MITNKDKPQQEGIYKNFFENLEEKGRLKGKAEGEAKGEAKGKVEGLSILLKAKFGLVDSLILKKIADSTIEDLDRYFINVLTANKIDDVFNK